MNGTDTWELPRASGSVWVPTILLLEAEANRLATGYGATTFPGLTEAITFEKNITLANFEAARLTEAVEKMAAALRA